MVLHVLRPDPGRDRPEAPRVWLMEPVLYVLDQHRRIAVEPDFKLWSAWMMDLARRTVGHDEAQPGLFVTTLFSGMDHRAVVTDPPMVFETTVHRIRGVEHEYVDAAEYAFWGEALAGHRAQVRAWRKREP